ncbi:response regulator [Paenibacillus sp. FSL W8-1187]|uniref:response regulator n=1 Tax=Paenibacillus sp. FSL W8-1187 TaxID=2975339 RepID=UPI0030DBC0B5
MLNVLIVDDELLMRIGLKSLINWEEEGFRITGEAANGKEALELAEAAAPDLIVTDIKMPVMDGLELIREVQRDRPDCQYVILSCLDEFHYAQEAIRLGAADYLIKSDMKSSQLLRVLDVVKKRAAKTTRKEMDGMPPGSVKESIEYLKETLFKEVISGYKGERDIAANRESLRIRVQDGPMLLAKFRIDRFEYLRRKYVEQDEKLLRYAILNILEEIIPRQRQKEIIVMNSAEYVLLMEWLDDGPPQEFEKLVDKIQEAMNDFLNLTMSIGASKADGYKGTRKAFQEADEALDDLFFSSGNGLVYYDRPRKKERCIQRFVWKGAALRSFRQDAELGSETALAFLEELKEQLREGGYTKQAARSAYIRVLGLISSCFPVLPDSDEDGLNVYEKLLREERLEGLHRTVVDYLNSCRSLLTDKELPRSYAEQACEMMRQLYTEDISLQFVAEKINVNASYLSRIFKRETGVNFVGYLTRLRMEKAKAMLRENRLKVYEVAERVGYPNTAYFSKLFKKHCGMTPEEFRGSAGESKK